MELERNPQIPAPKGQEPKPAVTESLSTGGTKREGQVDLPEPSRAPSGPANPYFTAPSELQPDAVNQFGCQVFRHENAQKKLIEWGFPLMSGSRYPFDSNLKGFEQFDTPQDAHYFGKWTSVDRLATVSYAEGDVFLSIAPDEASFRAQIRDLYDWNHNYDPTSGVHTQMDSPRLQAMCLVGHPLFDTVMDEYNNLKAREREYEALHGQVYAKLEDPSLPEGSFRIVATDDYNFYLRGRRGDYKVFCACKKEGGDLNGPEYTFFANGSSPDQISMLKRFLDKHGDKMPSAEWLEAEREALGMTFVTPENPSTFNFRDLPGSSYVALDKNADGDARLYASFTHSDCVRAVQYLRKAGYLPALEKPEDEAADLVVSVPVTEGQALADLSRQERRLEVPQPFEREDKLWCYLDQPKDSVLWHAVFYTEEAARWAWEKLSAKGAALAEAEIRRDEREQVITKLVDSQIFSVGPWANGQYADADRDDFDRALGK